MACSLRKKGPHTLGGAGIASRTPATSLSHPTSVRNLECSARWYLPRPGGGGRISQWGQVRSGESDDDGPAEFRRSPGVSFRMNTTFLGSRRRPMFRRRILPMLINEPRTLRRHRDFRPQVASLECRELLSTLDLPNTSVSGVCATYTIPDSGGQGAQGVNVSGGNFLGTLDGTTSLQASYCVRLDLGISAPESYDATVTKDGSVFGAAIPNAARSPGCSRTWGLPRPRTTSRMPFRPRSGERSTVRRTSSSTAPTTTAPTAPTAPPSLPTTRTTSPSSALIPPRSAASTGSARPIPMVSSSRAWWPSRPPTPRRPR